MEQINTHLYKRGGKRFEDNTGKTDEGLPIMWTDHLDADPAISKGQPLRESPEEIRIRFRKDEQGRGVLESIYTTFGYVLLANDGSVLLQTAHDRGMKANEQDKKDFAVLFEMALAFMRNGRVRAVEGHNYLPVARIDEQGRPADIPDSDYEGGGKVVDGVAYTPDSEPVGNYDTHRVDGTAINPTTNEGAA